MATNEQAVITIPKRSHSYNNAPLNSNNGRNNNNPITSNDIHITNTGIVREKQGKVFMTESLGESKSVFLNVLIKDEFGNLVEMVRNSNEGDVSTGSYVSNQGVKNLPIPRNTRINGRPSRNTNPDGSKTL
jgi:hypothetical protein